MLTKRCSRCKQQKDLSCFNKLRSAKDGLSYKCRLCAKEIKAIDWRKNPEKRKAAVKKWKLENPEKAKEAERIRTNRWNEKNRDTRRAMTKKWFSANPGIKAFYAASRRSAIRRQSIPLTEEQIAEINSIYYRAKIISEETGIIHHVDHIIPLKAKGCSGLHVPWNLQIITAQENFQKNNSIPIGATGTAFL